MPQIHAGQEASPSTNHVGVADLLRVRYGRRSVEMLGSLEERVHVRVDQLVEEHVRQLGVHRRVELEGHLATERTRFTSRDVITSTVRIF